MKKGMNYGLFMIVTMGLSHTPYELTVLLSYIIGLIWSINMLWISAFKKEWDWFFSSTFTWQVIGFIYYAQNNEIASIANYTGAIVSFSFFINSIISLLTPQRFTTIFDRQYHDRFLNKKIKLIYKQSTLIWTIFILLNGIVSLIFQRLTPYNISALSMVFVAIGIIYTKKWMKYRFLRINNKAL